MKTGQLTGNIKSTGYSRWSKDGSQIQVKQVNACKMVKQITKNRNKDDSINPIPTPWKTQPNGNVSAFTIKDR